MRATVREMIDVAIEAVDPGRLTASAMRKKKPATRSVIAIGKAAPAMLWGAEEALGRIHGLCVSVSPESVPDDIEVIVGDHPVPGEASFEAGRRVLQHAVDSERGCVVLISGGGSALCEWPRPGVDFVYLQEVNRLLLHAGTSIRETNTVRGHLSAIKCGGLARAAIGPLATYILSDVAGESPEVVASGPTVPMGHEPERAREILERVGMDVPTVVWDAMCTRPEAEIRPGPMTVVGDGMMAASAVASRASERGIEARTAEAWLKGNTGNALDTLFAESGSALTIAVGETSLRVEGEGRGGRNTHAALVAAMRIAGTDSVFCAFATDGVDGSAEAAGAIVDGGTLSRGGDPLASLEEYDSATYLERTDDLIVTGPTGTNVADLWMLWRP